MHNHIVLKYPGETEQTSSKQHCHTCSDNPEKKVIRKCQLGSVLDDNYKSRVTLESTQTVLQLRTKHFLLKARLQGDRGIICPDLLLWHNHLMQFVPGVLFFCSRICLTHWTPERNTDLAAFASLMGKLLSQVAANPADVWPACGNSDSSEHSRFFPRAVLVLQSSGFQWPGYYKELLV